MRRRFLAVAAPWLVAAALSGCGGGGGDAPATPAPSAPTGNTPQTPTGPTYTPGVYPASSTYRAQCAAPRTGTNPATGLAWPDRPGSDVLERFWLRSWVNELYLWYDEVLDRDPALTPNTLTYFEQLKTPATTSSGRPKDRFHFTIDTEEWRQQSQLGNVFGYGISWDLVSSTPPRRVVVQFVEPAAAAVGAGVVRGMEVRSIDGIGIDDNSPNGISTLNRGLSPAVNGQSHQFVLRDRSGVDRTITLTSTTVPLTPVPVVRVLPGGVGYLVFNDHIATAEKQLVDGIRTLRDAGIVDLVLDLRYNGGGYLDIASEVAYMIGGTNVAGKVFERTQFNAKYPSTNPVIGGPLEAKPFYPTTQGFSLVSGQPLPTLNLPRVVVLTSADTCSASESIINGLAGAGVQVVQVGANTCGKPYGFYPADNCGTTYFAIQFRGVNAQGFGEYADGFSANRFSGDARANLPGCAVADDLKHDLGDSAEGQLAAGLGWLRDGACTSTISGLSAPRGPRAAAATSGGEGAPPGLRVPEDPTRTNRILNPLGM